MRTKFCPKCGREIEKLYENLCKDCFLEKIQMDRNLPNEITIKRCKNCDSYIFNDKEYKTEKEIIEYFLRSLFPDKKISINYKIVGNEIHAKIKFKISKLEKILEKSFNFKIKPTICKYCGLKLGKYFTTIIQIRGNVNENIIYNIENHLNKLIEKDKFAFISDVVKLSKGFDIFIGSKSAASEIINELKRKYNINIKISRKICGLKKGKSLYRDTILIEFGKI